MRRILILGAGSRCIQVYVRMHREDEIVFVSSKPDKAQRIYSYSDLESFSQRCFDRVLVVSSGCTSGSLPCSYYSEINNKIQGIISNLKYKTGSKITFLSSFSVFPRGLAFVDATSAPAPETSYGESKLRMEKYLFDFCSLNQISLNVFRLPVFLYKGVQSNFMGNCLRLARLGADITLFNRYSSLSAVFSDDNLYELDEKLSNNMNVVNLGSRADISFDDLAAIFERINGSRILWRTSTHPSVTVENSQIEQYLQRKICSSSQISAWFEKELL